MRCLDCALIESMDADDELELLEAMYADDVDVQRSSGDNALLERIDVRLRSDGASMTLRLACDGGKWRTSIEAWRGPMSERSRVAAAARGDSMLEIVDSARDALNDVVEAPPAAAADETVAKPEEEEESWAGALWEVTHFTGCRSWPSRRWVESGGVHVPKGATGVVAEYVDGWVRAEGSSLWMPTKGKSSSVRLVHVRMGEGYVVHLRMAFRFHIRARQPYGPSLNQHGAVVSRCRR